MLLRERRGTGSGCGAAGGLQDEEALGIGQARQRAPQCPALQAAGTEVSERRCHADQAAPCGAQLTDLHARVPI